MEITEKFIRERKLSKIEYVRLLEEAEQEEVRQRLREEAQKIRQQYYGDKVYIRGLIEFTNYCRNNCYYCGIRKGNQEAKRYRLCQEEILDCCQKGYELGFRTFVLQGGEDPWFDDRRLTELVRRIREAYPDCAITLSVGERSYESYKKLREAGADRYLLRHETADEVHYRKLHPEQMSLTRRKECLWNLKELGYQVGAGFMVGSPGQSYEELAEDLLFLKELKPEMVGIGPFVPHHSTRFAQEKSGSVELTLALLSIVRILLPTALLPATTALGTLDLQGREKGLLSGANVLMPNLSPVENRKQYDLYDHKLCMGEEAAEGLQDLKKRIENIGFRLSVERGDFCEWFTDPYNAPR